MGVSKNMVGNCVLIFFFYGFLPALNFHLQCYRLRCFFNSFAQLVSGDGAHVSATFSRPERGRTAKSQTEMHLVLAFPMFFKDVG